jgi:hypothetical protein
VRIHIFPTIGVAVKQTALVILLAAMVFAEEPIRFRGAYVGEPLSDFVDCDGAKGKSRKPDYKLHGKVCEGNPGRVFHTKTKGLMNPKTEGEVLWFEDHKLVKITIMVPNEDWDKVRYDLSEKLGPPLEEVPQVFQNGFGARWEYDRGFWSKGDIVAYAGIQVETLGHQAINDPFTNKPAVNGIETTVTDAQHAKLPQTRPNSLD